ncbi:hypothetical protein FPV67DRAFT_1755391 [Lyophyllum atratum]|nr:hypothetical protein FPV67DRAFT_1755391 [Lyophyllum atratum]
MPGTRTRNHHQHTRNANETDAVSPTESVARASVTKRKRDTAAKPKPVALGEVIEISSDDEPEPPRNSALADLRRQVKQLKEENNRCKEDLAKFKGEVLSAREESLKLKALSGPGKERVVLDISQLEDSDWFNSTLAQFMNAHPHYDVNDSTPYLRQVQAIMHNPHILRSPQAAAYLAGLQHDTPQPQYTCPTCREAVKNRPVEDFTLKGLVRTVTAAAGETSPRKHDNSGRAPATALSRRDGPWDGFFPRAT